MSKDLERLRDWARACAKSAGDPLERKLWRQIADEVDAYLASTDLSPAYTQDEVLL